MNMKQYNRWYVATYDVILSIADWQNLTSDLERKLVCIFAWMPQAIMNVSHSGSAKQVNRKTKSDIFDSQLAAKCVRRAASYLKDLKDRELLSVYLPEIKQEVLGGCAPIFELLGSAAGSKFLHFSYPRLFPMWDRSLRKGSRLSDSPEGYFEYMNIFQRELHRSENIECANREYPSNPVRGWDICRMQKSPASNDGAASGDDL